MKYLQLSVIIVSTFCYTLASGQSLTDVEFHTHDRIGFQLWSTTQPVCILVHNPDNGPIQLPEPYTPPTVSELFGKGVTEADINEMQATRIQVGDNVTFAVTFADDQDEGFFDPVLGAARRSAFLFGAGVWAQYLQGPADISVMATMTPRGGSADHATLASAAPAGSFRNFANAPFTDTWYPEALVEIISGVDPDNSRLDINVDFNSDVDGTTVLGNRTFYYGTDGNPGNNFDFVTITIHELAHGLGFSSSFDSLGVFGAGTDFPFIYDRFLVNGSNFPLITQNTSPDIVTGNNVFWAGMSARYLYNTNFGENTDVPLFAPTPYNGGSSISHLDEDTFRGEWDLQTPFIGDAVHIPDVIVLGMLQDMGHSLAFSRYVKLNAQGFENGSNAHPFNELWKGLASLPVNGVLRLYPNVYEVSSGNNNAVVFKDPMSIASHGGVAVIRRSGSADIIQEKTETYQLPITDNPENSSASDVKPELRPK